MIGAVGLFLVACALVVFHGDLSAAVANGPLAFVAGFAPYLAGGLTFAAGARAWRVLETRAEAGRRARREDTGPG